MIYLFDQDDNDITIVKNIFSFLASFNNIKTKNVNRY